MTEAWLKARSTLGLSGPKGPPGVPREGAPVEIPLAPERSGRAGLRVMGR